MSRRAPTIRPDSTPPSVPRQPFVSADIALATPIFGGGATPGRADPALPVRGASVRGQLRFWWRACHASRYETSAELFAAESQIWGGQSAGSPSAVEIAVDILHPGEPRPYAYFERRRGPLAYVLFPFRSQRPEAVALEGVRFRLRLFLGSHISSGLSAGIAREARDALWAWTTFGGLGARTRRGCGALAYNAPPKLTADWLLQQSAQHISGRVNQAPPRLPLLNGARCLLYGGPPTTPWKAWETAIELLRGFRRPQPHEHRAWPEGASIRGALGARDRSGSTPASYPRADLGLPIVFQRMMSPDPVLAADGKPGRRRMASPIIVRPLVLSDGTSVPLILVLQAPHVAETGARLVWEVPGAPRAIRLSAEHLPSTARDELVDHVTRRTDWTEVRLQGSAP